MSSDPPAKFFVNQGLVTSATDLQHLLRPILKQTVSYRYHRGRDVVAHGTGWVERIVADQPDVSSYFTPIAITINVDSFEHLELRPAPTSCSSTPSCRATSGWSSSSCQAAPARTTPTVRRATPAPARSRSTPRASS